MIDEEVAAVILAIVVVGGVFAFSQVFMAGRVVEPFSEFGVLGSGMKIGGYPRTVLVNDTFRLYLYVGNHEGRLMYYILYVKLGDKFTFINESVPADSPIVASYELILPSGENRTIPVELSISRPMVNARLIFEMWILGDDLEPRYHGRWLQLWLNVTGLPTPP